MKHSRNLPYAFTENGVAMLASVLKSKQAVRISVYIVKTFIKLRKIISGHRELAAKLGQLEKKFDEHDKEIQVIFTAIHRLMAPPDKPGRKIGFLNRLSPVVFTIPLF